MWIGSRVDSKNFWRTAFLFLTCFYCNIFIKGSSRLIMKPALGIHQLKRFLSLNFQSGVVFCIQHISFVTCACLSLNNSNFLLSLLSFCLSSLSSIAVSFLKILFFLFLAVFQIKCYFWPPCFTFLSVWLRGNLFALQSFISILEIITCSLK